MFDKKSIELTYCINCYFACKIKHKPKNEIENLVNIGVFNNKGCIYFLTKKQAALLNAVGKLTSDDTVDEFMKKLKGINEFIEKKHKIIAKNKQKKII